MNLDMLWNNFLKKIKEYVSALSYETWFQDTKLVSIRDNCAIVIVPMELHKKHLMENYQEIMENTLKEVNGSNFTFKFVVEEEWEDEKNEDIFEEPYDEEDRNEHQKENLAQSPLEANLNPEYTFDSFIVGDSNKFAYTTSMAVAEKPGKAYNPLFLYGKSGLGKTHLMHSIGNYIIKNSNLRVLYISSDKFVNDFINAVRNDKDNYDKIDTFKNKYRNIDVLMIDDIQFLGNATKGQEEFFHTFNEL